MQEHGFELEMTFAKGDSDGKTREHHNSFQQVLGFVGRLRK